MKGENTSNRVVRPGRVFCTLLALVAFPLQAAEPAALPQIAIIIDDIGDHHAAGARAVDLPGAVACAFLPHTPYAAELAERAYENGKEVLLHLPLQSLAGKALGPGAITLDTTEAEFRRILSGNLASIPHVVGVNNHMGSLLTRHPGHMTWLMEGIARRGELYFVDSYTHADSVALDIAKERGIASARRDVFLDNVPTRARIRAEFERLIAIAKAEGHAIGIGHPYDETLAFLADALPRLAARGVELVPVSALLDRPEEPVLASSDLKPVVQPAPPVHQQEEKHDTTEKGTHSSR